MMLGPEHDDTRPEYYEGWRKATEAGEYNMSSLIPKSFDIVDLPEDRWPDFKTWGWGVWMRLIADYDGQYSNYRVSDLRRMISHHDRRTWIWDHNGCGDFVRISSQDMNDRFVVVFDHESGRSPYSDGNEHGYAPGFDFMQPIDLEMIAQSDEYLAGPNVAAMTEVYRYRYGSSRSWSSNSSMVKHLKKMGEWEEDRFITSPEIEAEGNGFASWPVFDEDDYKWLSPAVKRRRPAFEDLYYEILTGDLPTLPRLRRLLKNDDLLTAVAFDTMHRVADWMLSPDELHKKWMEER